MEVLKNVVETHIDVNFVENSDENFLLFLQRCQKDHCPINLNLVHGQDGKIFLILQHLYDVFFVQLSVVLMPEYERFFANLTCVVDTEKDLHFFVKNTQIGLYNIVDVKLLKELASLKFENTKYYIKLDGVSSEVNFNYLRNVISRNINESVDVKSIENLKNYHVYKSIIAERFLKMKFYNVDISLDRVSALYNVLNEKNKSVIKNIIEMANDAANFAKVPLHSVLTINAIETVMLKGCASFDEMVSIGGFNKKYFHNATLRKVLSLLESYNVEITRNKQMEIVLDAMLVHYAKGAEIDEKSLIASKFEIVAYINGNFDVDFLKGWKKEVFGCHVMDFIENKSVIESKNMKFYVSSK